MVNSDDYALVIGVNDYPNFRPLNGAIGDAEDVRDWLVDRNIGGGLPDANCRVVLSSANPLRPLQDDVDDALLAIKASIDATARPARRFYFYFSGHGLGETYGDTAVCLAKWSELWRFYALHIPGYCDLIAESGLFSEIAIFLDCCRTRLISAGGNPPLFRWVRPAWGAGATRRFIAYATEYQNPAYEAAVGEDRNVVRGYFTRALLSALRGGAAMPDAGVPASELKKYLELHTPRLAEEKGQRQKPQVENGFASDPEPRFGAAPPVTNVRIQFSSGRAGEIVLEDGKLNVIRRGDASSGPWNVALPSGLNLITELRTGEQKAITIRVEKEVADVTF